MTESEFEKILSDTSKIIEGDIKWAEDEDHSPAVEFRAEVASKNGYPIFVRGSYNQRADTLTYALIHRNAGRVYGLDLGKEHHNPDCNYVGDKHKHIWTEQFRDKHAYSPEDITADTSDPVAVWKQFCAESSIIHNGNLLEPPPSQMEFL